MLQVDKYYTNIDVHVATPSISISTALIAGRNDERVTLVTHKLPARLRSSSHLETVVATLRRLSAAGVLHLPQPRRVVDDATIEFAFHSRQTLSQRISADASPMPRTLQSFIAQQIGDTLTALHRHNLTLSTLCSDVIMIDDAGDVLVFDYSHVASTVNNNQSRFDASLPVHQLLSLAPEQTGRVDRPIDSRTDLYNFGVILYEMSTRRMPFDDLLEKPDVLEYVHAILARTPTPPMQRDSTISSNLNDLIMCLLEKNADLRYESITNLMQELHQVLSSDDAVYVRKTFNVISKFRRPNHLYGREVPSAQLMNEFDGMIADRVNRFTTVAGIAGSGKSALVQSIREKISMQSALRSHVIQFAGMKFEQFVRQQLTCFGVIVADLLRSILTQPTAVVQRWRKQILESVSTNGSLFIQMFPLLQQVIGDQPDVPELAPAEAQKRVSMLLPRFLASLTSHDRPLLLFFDDLQWADSNSIGQIISFIQQHATHSVCILAAYRSEEVSPTHPLVVAQNELRTNARQSVVTQNVIIESLTIESITSLCSNVLKCFDNENVRSLSSFLHHKSAGNIFFVLQLLEAYFQRQLITLDSNGEWTWNIATLMDDRVVTDNVIDVVQLNLRRVSPGAQRLATAAAFIGVRFSCKMMSWATNDSEVSCEEFIRELINENIIVLETTVSFGEVTIATAAVDTADNRFYAFAHDRIQQAALELCPPHERADVFYKIGQLLLQHVTIQSGDDILFDAEWIGDNGLMLLNLFTHCIQSIQCHSALRLTLIRFVIALGEHIKVTAAYTSYLRYARFGMVLLGLINDIESNEYVDADPLNSWTEHYVTTLQMTMLYAEAEYVCGHIGRAQSAVEKALIRTQTAFDRANVIHFLSVVATAQSKWSDAMQLSRQALRGLETEMLRDPNHSHANSDESYFRGDAALNEFVLSEIDRLLQMSSADINTLLELPLTTSQTAIAQARALADQTYPAYLIDGQTRDYIGLFLLHRALSTKTLSGYEGYTLAFVGIYLVSKHRLREAADVGRVALSLASKFRKAEVAKTLVPVATCVMHWTVSYEDDIQYMNRAVELSLETGDVTFASLALGTIFLLQCFNSTVLEMIQQATQQQQKIAQIQDNLLAVGVCEIVIRTAQRLLRKPNVIRATTDIEWVNDARLLIPLLHTLYQVHTTMVDYILLDDAAAIRNSTDADLGLMVGLPHVPIRQLFRALAILRSVRRNSSLMTTSANELMTETQEIIRVFNIWSSQTPSTFKAIALLLEAEHVWTNSIEQLNSKVAIIPAESIHSLYQSSLSAFEFYVNDKHYAVHAVAMECYARFCFHPNTNHSRGGIQWIQRSISAYSQYGAETKVAALIAEFPSAAAHMIQTEAFIHRHSENTNFVTVTTFRSDDESIGIANAPNNAISVMPSTPSHRILQAEPNVGENDPLQSYASLHPLDIRTLIQTAAAISSEMNLTKLLEKLTNTTLHNTGAERVILLSNLRYRNNLLKTSEISLSDEQSKLTKAESFDELEETDWTLDSVATSDGLHHVFMQDGIRSNTSPPLVSTMDMDYPRSIINYVVHTHEPVILSDAVNDHVFANDQFFSTRQVKSVLCLPLMNGNTLTNVLYLEHNKSVGNFTAARLLVCRTIARQATISIENALLCDQIRRSNAALKEKVRECIDATTRAEESAEARSFFIAHVSHEIRTPMNAILGVSRLLEDSDLSDDQMRYLQTITTSGNLLLTVISDILDISRMEHHVLVLEKAHFELVRCIEDTIHLLRELCSSKHIDLGYIIERDVPTHVIGDSARIQQILLNLIGNACKFCRESGGVMVRVSAQLVNQDETEVDSTQKSFSLFISVEDNGIGMSEKTQRLIFQPFSQGDNATSRQYGGTGLGLVIVKRLVEAMNGDITFHSQLGSGTTFLVNIQLMCEHARERRNSLLPSDTAWILCSRVNSSRMFRSILEAFSLTSPHSSTSHQ